MTSPYAADPCAPACDPLATPPGECEHCARPVWSNGFAAFHADPDHDDSCPGLNPRGRTRQGYREWHEIATCSASHPTPGEKTP